MIRLTALFEDFILPHLPSKCLLQASVRQDAWVLPATKSIGAVFVILHSSRYAVAARAVPIGVHSCTALKILEHCTYRRVSSPPFFKERCTYQRVLSPPFFKVPSFCIRNQWISFSGSIMPGWMHHHPSECLLQASIRQDAWILPETKSIGAVFAILTVVPIGEI